MLVMLCAWTCNKCFIPNDLGASPFKAETSFGPWYVRHIVLVCAFINLGTRNG